MSPGSGNGAKTPKAPAAAGIALWVIVLAGLLYGIWETVVRSVDLFT